MKNTYDILTPGDFGLESNPQGELILNDHKLIDLAEEFDTPLYVLDTKRLLDRAGDFMNCARRYFDGRSRVFYPFKCNSVPAVINTIKKAGFSAEVMTEYELELALNCGFAPSEIIVNGPCKSESFLAGCVKLDVHMIVIDSISELLSLHRICRSVPAEIDLLLRVNPDFIPKGMNKNSATGSRLSSFGMDEEEICRALSVIKQHPNLNFKGVHFHIGTGIRDPKVYSQAIRSLHRLFGIISACGFEIRTLDVGGGFASMTTRELTSFEMLAAQALGSYRLAFKGQRFYSFDEYMKEIFKAVRGYFGRNMPDVCFEPGRCIASSSQTLLLRVHRIKERNGMKWIITDGGLGTLTMPTYYEYHEMFLCNDINREPRESVTITGPCCFASDLVYKNKLMPAISEGEILALMDTGAYFNSLESSFNFYKPAIIAVGENDCRLVRRRESFSDMIQRDEISMSAYGGELS